MNFLKKHDIVLKLVALLVAVFMWSYVVVLENPAKVVKFPGAAIEMTGVSQLEERGLMLVTETDPKIDVSVTGTTDDVVKLNAADIKAVVDFSDIQEISCSSVSLSRLPVVRMVSMTAAPAALSVSYTHLDVYKRQQKARCRKAVGLFVFRASPV